MSVTLEEVCEHGIQPIPEHRRSKLPESCTYFSAVLLSVWDNILGPQVYHVWNGPTAHRLQPGIIQYVSSHTLNGEIVRADYGEHPGERISAKLFVFAEKDACVTAFIFKGHLKSGSCLFSLCLVMTIDQLTSYLPLHDLCEAKMKCCITQLIRMQKQGIPIQQFSSVIEKFVQSVASIALAPLTDVKLQSTVFHGQACEIFEVEFVKRCITSHLQTCCCTVVVGEAIEPLNMLISTLALFLSPAERLRSRYAVNETDTGDLEYESNLFLQGLLVKRGESYHKKIPSSEVIRTKLPSTLINVTALTVEQTNLTHKHHAMRDDFLALEYNLMMEPGRRREEALQSADISKTSFSTFPAVPDSSNFYKNLFRETYDHSKLVQDFLREVYELVPSCGVREAYISQFARLLQRKALALIKYVGAEDNTRFDLPLGPGISREIIKKLKKALSLEMEGDFKIILATAEKLRPGMFLHLLGDPAAQCKKVQEELEVL